MSSNIKALTLNLHSWREENQLEKFQRIAETIAEHEIDVVAFQEASQHRDTPLLAGNIREDNAAHLIWKTLAERTELPFTLHWDWSHYGWKVYEEGVAILTHHRVVDLAARYISVSRSKDDWLSRKVIRLGIEIGNEIVDIYSCHAGWWEDDEEPFSQQFESLLALTKERPHRCFLMGDFNNPAETPGYNLMLTHFIDLFPLGSNQPGFTTPGGIAGWEGKPDGERIDYIFTNRKVSRVRAEVLFEDEPVSDHFGLMMKIDW